MEEEDNKALKRLSESQEDKAAKKQKLDEEVAELKKHLQIVPNDDDDVYTEATPLACKELVKERFASSKPKNFSDDFLVTTLTYMFEKLDVQAQLLKNQRTVHGLENVKSWRLLESYGVHIITFTSTQMILLVERRYPLLRFTLDQLINNVRLKVEEESEGVVIRDLKETATPPTIIHTKAKSNDKWNGILVEEPKPLKKQAQIKQDEAYARELEVELNKNKDWDEVVDHEQIKEKEDNVVKRYQALKRKPQTEAQARKNMMIYLRNMAGFKMDYFKGMAYDDIYNKALKRLSESQEDKAAKKQKLDEEVAELKKHLQIVPNDDDDDKIAQALEITKLKQRVKKLEKRNKLNVSKLRRLKKVSTAQKVETSNDIVMGDVYKQGRMITDMDADVDVTLKDIAKDVAVDFETKESADVRERQAESQAQIYQIDLEHADKVLSMQDDKVEPAELQEIVEVVTTTKLITEVVNAASTTITAATLQITTAAAPTLTTAPSAARSQEDKAAKKQKLDEEVAELKKHLQIVPNDDDDVYTEATPLACKELVKERFASSKPKNFSDDFLVTTLTYMFEKLDVQAQLLKNQRTVHGLENVKSWRLLESYGVHIITFTSTQMILLVERRYPLLRFTLDQLINNVRLKVEEESEVSLELLRFIRQQQQEGFKPE
nr:hypothetical protein [Tanacetum cinerariifolium]